MLRIVASFMTICLCSCATELVTHPEAPGIQATRFVCSTLEVEEAARRLEKAWRKCFVRSGQAQTATFVGGTLVVIPINVGVNRIELSQTDGVRKISVIAPSKFLIEARLFKTKSCGSLVSVISHVAVLSPVVSSTESWLNDPDASGPMLNCN